MRISDWSSDVCSSDLVGAILVLPQRRRGHVLGDGALQRIGDDQGRRGEIVGAGVGRHAALEIAVAGKDRRGDPVVRSDERRVGTEVVSACRSWGSPSHYKKNKYKLSIRIEH